MGTGVLGFEFMKEMYKEDPDFSRSGSHSLKGIGFQGTNTCCKMGFYSKETSSVFQGVPRGPPNREVHSGGLGGHFGVQKTLDILQEQFYWPKMMGDVQNVLRRC
ncbi:uncharacterized protein LOC141637719 [Silene latifolia]|uniref:uncharacterized protein LOC141637719 n=1 Tax=Silene latifolia TaxID=37657 RepID=UPI003D784690